MDGDLILADKLSICIIDYQSADNLSTVLQRIRRHQRQRELLRRDPQTKHVAQG